MSKNEIWRSDCCNAPVVILRSSTSVFDYCEQEPDEALKAELETHHDVTEGSEFWMEDYVTVFHHACAQCRKFIGKPWIEDDDRKLTLDSAEKAISHVLNQIRDNDKVRYQLGAGTHSFGLLTEAAAKLWNKPVDEVREMFIPGSASLYRRGE